jgi:hypothetical protein
MFLGQSNITITKFLLHETGSYNKQYRRPYNTNLTGSTMNAIVEKLQYANDFMPSAMAGLANQFISPVATPEREIEMVNGWNERRMRFMMEVVVDNYTGGRIIEVVLGYTSHVGVGISGSIDPRMEFYINSVMHIRESIDFTPTGNRKYTTVSDNSHILVDNNWKGITSNEVVQRMRPEDVYVTIGRTHLTDLKPGTTYDTRAVLSTMPVKSRRANANSANYMATVIKGYNDATISSPLEANSYSILEAARGNSSEGLISHDPFLSAIGNIRGYNSGNSFTYNDLQMLDQNVEHVTKVKLMAPTHRVSVHQTGQTADWGASDLNTSVATILSNAVPGMLMELALTKVILMATNRTIGCVIKTTIIDVEGFSNGDNSNAIAIFITRLENEVLRDISYNGSMDFAVEMHIDLLGETWIKLSLNGQPAIDYVTPSFCDALLTPVITSDDTRAMTLASDFDTLTSQLIDSRTVRRNAINTNWTSGAI